MARSRINGKDFATENLWRLECRGSCGGRQEAKKFERTMSNRGAKETLSCVVELRKARSQSKTRKEKAGRLGGDGQSS